MRLHVQGNACIAQNGEQHIHVTHEPDKAITKVVCHADVVTVGIAISVLKKEFDIAVNELDSEELNRLMLVIEEATA